jgi:hypothetical protein
MGIVTISTWLVKAAASGKKKQTATEKKDG